MSCAHQLAEHPDKFSVTLADANAYCGGQAFSIPLDRERFGASWLNQGVQGGSYIFHHTMAMFARQGFRADPVKLQVAFGKDDTFWTNVYPTKLLEMHQKEVKRFYTMLRWVRWLEVVFALVPLKVLMKIWGFSTDFTNMVALPMVALFLGTGNYTPQVPTIMLERLCTSPTYGMWYPSDKQSIASNLPPMVVFPNFSEFYGTWKENLAKRGVDVRLETEVTAILHRGKNGIIVQMKQNHTPGTDNELEQKEEEEVYDELVLCVQ
jgi:hypothetical protein